MASNYPYRQQRQYPQPGKSFIGAFQGAQNHSMNQRMGEQDLQTGAHNLQVGQFNHQQAQAAAELKKRLGAMDLNDAARSALFKTVAGAWGLANPDQRAAFIQQRIPALAKMGVSQGITSGLLQMTPETAQQFIQAGVITGDLQGSQDNRTSNQRDRASLLNDLNSPDINRRQSAEIALGLKPGHGKTTAPERIAGDPELSSNVASSQGEIAGGKQAGKDAVVMSTDIIQNQLPLIRSGISNIDSALQALDDGANVGAVSSRLPSFMQASVELDNVRNRMGLDIVGGSTFGALSASELEFALATAIPKFSDAKSMRDWLTKKRAAQAAMATELQKAAVFLGTPGNTPAMYLDMNSRPPGGRRSSDIEQWPSGTIDNGDGTFTAPDGITYEPRK